MPVVGRADVSINLKAEDYIRLSKCRKVFDGIELEKIFIRKVPKGLPTCDDVFGILFYTVICSGLLSSLIFTLGKLEVIIELISLGMTIITAILLLKLSRNSRIRNQFGDAYLEYLRGYESAFDHLNECGWQTRIPIESSKMYKYTEVRNLGAYHAMKFFAPCRPQDIVKILAEANYSDPLEYKSFVDKYTKITKPLIKYWKEFDEEYNFELQILEYYNKVYPYGFYSDNPVEQQAYDKRRAKELDQKGFYGLDVNNDYCEGYRFLANTFDLRNPDATLNASEVYTDIKEYVDPVDGEIYRYRTEKEQEEIKNRRKTK